MTKTDREIMKKIPIIFSAEMVRAVLDGRKTQTRRVIKPQPPKKTRGVEKCLSNWECFNRPNRPNKHNPGMRTDYVRRKCPYGVPGDRLWVRESISDVDGDGWCFYTATNDDLCSKEGKPPIKITGWPRTIPSIHMPRWASRITLEVKNIRVERVQEISEGDAKAEGTTGEPDEGQNKNGDYFARILYRLPFMWLWDSIYKAKGHGWDVNPWVWVVEFERVI